jgi:hypothetical protein
MEDTHDQRAVRVKCVKDYVTLVRKAPVTGTDILGGAPHFRVGGEQFSALAESGIAGLRLPNSSMDRSKISSISRAAASESLTIRTATALHVLPNLPNGATRHAALLPYDEGLDQGFPLILIFLIAADKVTNVIAHVAVMADSDLIFNPALHGVG